jgi:hippurate hydrolase
MKLIDEIVADKPLLTEWRRDFHAHPELAYEEHRTSKLVAERLASFGVEVHTGFGGTGVVGRLTAGTGNRAVALRADMDALPMTELNEFAHCSTAAGRMHGCGHDGHTTMLLGAAKHLAADPRFDGTVYFIFQPAEEGEAGAKRMIDDGLFEKFPVESVYGMHNWPGMPIGSFAVKPGPMMAAVDVFEMAIIGEGSHAAMPHQGVDSVVTAAQVITGLQTIASRNVNPIDAVVVSVTMVHGGDADNVLPERVVLGGTVRTFRDSVRDAVEPAMRRIAGGICAATGARFELDYTRLYPATINTLEESEIAAEAAAAVAGEANVDLQPVPSMGGEDFAFMLRERPGSYVWVGNGPGEGGCTLHNPRYDFNDEALPVGASYWVELTRKLLPEPA